MSEQEIFTSYLIQEGLVEDQESANVVYIHASNEFISNIVEKTKGSRALEKKVGANTPERVRNFRNLNKGYDRKDTHRYNRGVKKEPGKKKPDISLDQKLKGRKATAQVRKGKWGNNIDTRGT